MGALPKELLEHLNVPRNAGEAEGATGRGAAANAACGDHLEISARVEAGRVTGIGFRARGCSALLATASLATEAARDLELEEARALDVEDLVKAAGGLPPGKAHAHRMVKRALAEALG